MAADPETFPPLTTALVVLAIAMNVAATLGSSTALALGREKVWSFRYPLQNSLVIVAAGLLGSRAGSAGAVAGIAVAVAGALCWSALPVLNPLRRASPGARLPPEAIRYGVFQAASALMTLLVVRGGIPLVAILASSSLEAGYASIAIGVVLAATSTLNQAFTVQLPSLIGQARPGDALHEGQARRLADVAQLMVLPVAIGAALALEPGLSVALGEEFRGVEDAFLPVLATLPLTPLAALANNTAALRLRPEERLKGEAAAAVTFFAIAIPLVPAWGAAGATTALLAGTLVRVAYGARSFPDPLTPRRLGLSLMGSLLALLAAAAV